MLSTLKEYARENLQKGKSHTDNKQQQAIIHQITTNYSNKNKTQQQHITNTTITTIRDHNNHKPQLTLFQHWLAVVVWQREAGICNALSGREDR